MIQRRTILQAGALASFGAPALIGFAQEAPVQLKFYTFMSPKSFVWNSMHMAWMDKVEKEAGGKIKFVRENNLSRGGRPDQLFDQAASGESDVVWGVPTYSASKYLKTEAFELPFMMTNGEATSRAFYEFATTSAKSEYAKVKLLAAHVNGPGYIHTVKKEVRTASDMKGLRLRSPSRAAGKLLSALGATSVSLPLTAIADQLQKGGIDGVMSAFEVGIVAGINKFCQYHTGFSDSIGGICTVPFVLAMNPKTYASLSPELKKVIDANSGIETSAWLGKTQLQGDIGPRADAIKNGQKVDLLDGPEAKSFKALISEMEKDYIKDVAARGYNGSALVASAHALIAKHTKA